MWALIALLCSNGQCSTFMLEQTFKTEAICREYGETTGESLKKEPVDFSYKCISFGEPA